MALRSSSSSGVAALAIALLNDGKTASDTGAENEKKTARSFCRRGELTWFIPSGMVYVSIFSRMPPVSAS